jgi:hypothetical protein
MSFPVKSPARDAWQLDSFNSSVVEVAVLVLLILPYQSCTSARPFAARQLQSGNQINHQSDRKACEDAARSRIRSVFRHSTREFRVRIRLADTFPLY